MVKFKLMSIWGVHSKLLIHFVFINVNVSKFGLLIILLYFLFEVLVFQVGIAIVSTSYLPMIHLKNHPLLWKTANLLSRDFYLSSGGFLCIC